MYLPLASFFHMKTTSAILLVLFEFLLLCLLLSVATAQLPDEHGPNEIFEVSKRGERYCGKKLITTLKHLCNDCYKEKMHGTRQQTINSNRITKRFSGYSDLLQRTGAANDANDSQLQQLSDADEEGNENDSTKTFIENGSEAETNNARYAPSLRHVISKSLLAPFLSPLRVEEQDEQQSPVAELLEQRVRAKKRHVAAAYDNDLNGSTLEHRQQLGIVAKCCINSCTYNDLTAYCCPQRAAQLRGRR